jgi:hypothetical protein
MKFKRKFRYLQKKKLLRESFLQLNQAKVCAKKC